MSSITPSIGGTSTESPIPTTGAGVIASGQFEIMQRYADTAFSGAQNALTALSSSVGDVEFPEINTTNTPNTIDVGGIGFVKRPKDKISVSDYYLPRFYGLLPRMSIDIPAFDPPPGDLRPAPELDFGNKPIVQRPPLPDERPPLLDVEKYIPDDLTLEFPPVPELEEFNFPPLPEIIEHEFQGVRPDNDLHVPEDSAVAKLPTPEYQSELQSEIKAYLRTSLQGGTGLPPAIEQMIFARARDREETTAERAIQEAMDDWADRGFTLPSGVLDMKMQAARQANQAQANAFSRELEIESYKREIENLQFAVTQGITLENINTQLHMNFLQLALAQAQAVDQFVLNTFSSQVELYNAEVSMFRTEAEVYRELIRAELSKVEMFRSQIEAERVRGEVNQQKVAAYRTQLEAVATRVQVYNSQMEAANIVSNVNANLIRVRESDINAYRAMLEANKSEYDAWAAEIQGELGKVQGYEAEARAFSARASAYETSVNAKTIGPRLKIDKYLADVQGYQSSIEKYRADIEARQSVVSTKANLFQNHVQAYRAEVDKKAKDLDVSLEEERIKLQDRQRETQEAIQRNEIESQNVNNVLQATVTSLQSVAQISSQLAAAAMSAINASASVSESGSASNSWSYSKTDSESESTVESTVESNTTIKNID